jgi:preprotein translocase subunit YajC
MKSSEILVAVVFAVLIAIGVYYVVSRDVSITPEQEQMKIQREILEELRSKDN